MVSDPVQGFTKNGTPRLRLAPIPPEDREAYVAYRRPILAARMRARRSSNREETRKLGRSTNYRVWDRLFGWELGTTEKLFLAATTCALCGKPFEGTWRDPLAKCIDHDHSTNHFRGIIHNNCNCGLGFWDDSIETLKKAIAYLEASRGKHS